MPGGYGGIRILRRMSEDMILTPQEVEKRLKAWADVTQLCLELRLAVLRKRYPHLDDETLREMRRKEIAGSKEP